MKEDIHKFLLVASDEDFLFMKIVLIMEIAEGCQSEELAKMTLGSITEKETILIVKVKNTKYDVDRTVIVVDRKETINLNLFQKYLSLHPSHTSHSRLFIFYNQGRCIVQPVEIHTFGKIPSKIVQWLKLPNPEEFTGYCFRRSSATFLADSGAA